MQIPVFEYRPHSKYESAVDDHYCRAAVAFGGRGIGFRQCSRKAVVDGKWCRLHSPATREQRARAREAADTERATHDAAVQREARQIARRLGLKGTAASFDPRHFYYTRQLVVPFDELHALIARLTLSSP